MIILHSTSLKKNILKMLMLFFFITFFSCNKKEDKNTIPFEKDGCFYIYAFLNDTIKGRFIFDTGADGLYLDSTFLSRNKALINITPDTARMRGAGSTGFRKVILLKDSIKVTIGANNIQTFSNIPVLELTAINGDNIAGIIGNEFIRNQVLAVNNDNSTLKITQKINENEYDDEVSFKYDDGRIYIETEINMPNNVVVNPLLLVDLGCPDAIILNTPFFIKNQHLIGDNITYSILHGGALGGCSNGGDFRALSTRLGDYELKNTIISYSTDTLGAFSNNRYDGLLGNEILDRFNFAIDYKNEKLYFKKNKKFEEPFLSTSTGFHALKRGKFATVESLFHQSEACKNGLQLGDTIIEINDRNLSNMKDDEFYNIMKGKDRISLKISRNQKQTEISFTPKYLLE